MRYNLPTFTYGFLTLSCQIWVFAYDFGDFNNTFMIWTKRLLLQIEILS